MAERIVDRLKLNEDTYILGGGTGKHLAEPFFHPDPDPPVGAIRARGETFHRGLYAALWAEVQRLDAKYRARNLTPLLVSDADWQTEATAQGGYCAKYSTGDGSTTFRVPFYGRMFGAATTDAEINAWVNDCIVNITGAMRSYCGRDFWPVDGSLAISVVNDPITANPANSSPPQEPCKRMVFNAANAVRTGPEVTPKAVYLPVYIHAFHAIQDPAALQAQETLNALNGKLDASRYEADAPMRVKAWGFLSGRTSNLTTTAGVIYPPGIIAAFNIAAFQRVGRAHYKIWSPAITPTSVIIVSAQYSTDDFWLGEDWQSREEGAAVFKTNGPYDYLFHCLVL